LKRLSVIVTILIIGIYLLSVNALAEENIGKILVSKTYEEYINEFNNMKYAKTEVIINSADYYDTNMDIIIKKDFEGQKGQSIITSDEGRGCISGRC